MTMPFLFGILSNGRTLFRWILPHADREMIGMASDYCKIASLAMPVRRSSLPFYQLAASADRTYCHPLPRFPLPFLSLARHATEQAMAAFECIRRYLAAFGLVTGPTYAYCVATPFALVCNYLLIQGP